MAKNVEQIIKEADVLIKQEKYSEAWKLLLPHKEDENARKRLKWLKSKQEQLKLEKEIAAAPVKKAKPNWFLGLGWRAKVFVGSIFLCSGCILFSMLGQTLGFIPDATERAATEVARANETSAVLTENAPTATETATASATFTASPSATNSPAPSTTFTATASETIPPTLTDSSIGVRSGASNATSAPSATFMASPSSTITDTPLPRATNTPALPTATYALYHAENLCPIGNVEDMLLEILANTEGVDFVESLCIQTFPDGSIWFSANIIVYPDYNTLAIPRSLDEAAVEALNNPDVETFIEMSDGLHAIAYTHNKTFPNWDIVVYTQGVVPQTPRPRADNPNSFQAPQSQAVQAPAPTSLPSGQTYYANNGDVRVRSCPRRDCDTLNTLSYGTSIRVLGSTTGDTVSGSNQWYEVNSNGQVGYVHTSLLVDELPAPTTVVNSVQNPPPVSQQQWSCSGDIYNCGDLTCSQIDSYMSACPSDPSGLDGPIGPSGNGNACQSKCG